MARVYSGAATSSPYTYTWANVSKGVYNLTAVATDNTGASTTSSKVTVAVTAHQPPTVSLVSPVTGSSYTSPASIVLSANASVTAGAITKVAFYNGTSLLGAATSSPYTYTWANVSKGVYNLTAVATDNTGASTTSSPAVVAVAAHQPPTVSLVSPVTGSSYTSPASIVLSANASVTAGAITKVAFYNGTSLLGAATSSPYTYTWANVSKGVYNLTAVATDNTGASTTSSKVTVAVTAHQPPTVSLVSPVTGSSYTSPASIVLSANASVTAGAITKVAFYNGTSLLGAATSSPYTYTWANVSKGVYNLTAVATDSTGASTTSSKVTVAVTAHQPPTVSLVSPVTGSSYTSPASIVLSANASVTAGAITKVAFYNGTSLLGAATSSPYTYTWANVSKGVYNLTAVATDNTGASTTSLPVMVTVNSGSTPSPVPTTNIFIGVTHTADIFDNPVSGKRIDTEYVGAVGTVVNGPQTFGKIQFFQVHFPGSNMTGWISQDNIIVLATTSSGAAVYALIKYIAPQFSLTPATGALTQDQVSQLKAAMANLSGKKFMIFNGQVVLIQSDTNIQIYNDNDVICMQILGSNYGTAILADLTWLDTQDACNTAPWYDYIYCTLGNLSKTSPGADIGDNATVLSSIKSYLDTQFASVGGSTNFVISGNGTSVEVDPVPTNNLTGLDKYISMSFENDSLIYDKGTILDYLSAFQNDMVDDDTDSFFVVQDNILDELAVERINDIITSVSVPVYDMIDSSSANKACESVAPELASKNSSSIPAQSQSACYAQQSGSVIPCNSEIDLVDGNIGLPGPLSIFNKLTSLGYTVNPINRKDFLPDDGLGFLTAVVQSQGQVFLHKFHQSKKLSKLGGFFGPLGCAAGSDIANGNYLAKLNSSGLFTKKLTSADVYFSHWTLACFPKYCVYVRLTDTKINQKAIQAGYLCYGEN